MAFTLRCTAFEDGKEIPPWQGPNVWKRSGWGAVRGRAVLMGAFSETGSGIGYEGWL